MKCTQCGSENAAEATACRECGAPVGDRPAAGAAPSAAGGASMQGYDFVADKIGGVPNVRLKDNLIQGLSILATTVLGVLIGLLVNGYIGAVIGFAIGSIGGLLVSGLVLGIIGLIRKS